MNDGIISEVIARQSFGSNVQLVAEDKECHVLRLEASTGEGYMTLYQVMQGVYLMFNEFHLDYCESKYQKFDTVFCIDHCRQGRMEHENNDCGRYYMESGDIRIDRRIRHSGNVHMPTKYYQGITIGFQSEQAEASIRNEMPGIMVDIKSIAEKFCPDDKEFLLRKETMLNNSETIESIFNELYNVLKAIRIDFFKVKIMELLLRLTALDISRYGDERLYIPASQADRIKQVHKLMIDNPEKNYTVEELSKSFDIPESTLRKNFRIIYGSPIYKYIKNHKMNLAAEILKNDKNVKISDVAERVGYDNPSKFAAAFKDVMSVTPMAYKNK